MILSSTVTNLVAAKTLLAGMAALIALTPASCPDLFPCGPVFPPAMEYSLPPELYPDVVSMQAGQSQQFSIVRWDCCWMPEPAIATPCVRWTIDPRSAGTIDNNGKFVLSPDAQPGQQITIRASFPPPDILPFTATVTVYDPATNPLVGTWWNLDAIPCDESAETIPGQVGEIVFRADGRFLVTFVPFEVYHDYWGTYTFDHETGALSMTIDGGNHVPESTDLEGTVIIHEDGTFLFDDIDFGAPYGETQPEPICGYGVP